MGMGGGACGILGVSRKKLTFKRGVAQNLMHRLGERGRCKTVLF